MSLAAHDPAAVAELRVTIARLARRLRQERHDDQLTPSQTAVLGTLLRDGPLTPGDLAAIEHVQPPSMTRIIGALEANGWVVKQRSPTDGRQILVRPTRKALDWVDLVRAHRDQWLQERLSSMTTEELSVLDQAIPLLDRISCGD